MTVQVDRKWFQERLDRKGLTLRKTAALVGIDPAALSRTLKGNRRMKLDEVAKIATVLEVTPSDVLAHMERPIDGGKPRGPAADDMRPRISRHPGFGFMKGLIKIEEGFDLTGPYADESWNEGYLGEDRH